MKKSIAMTGLWEQHCRAALASLACPVIHVDFFASVFYQEKIEGLAGEAKDRLKKHL